jgi:hypothetical protein
VPRGCVLIEKTRVTEGRLSLCFVYGADPAVLSPAPGGRDNAVVVSKATFNSLSLPQADGNYFLRPDRILAAFLFDPLVPPPVGYSEAAEAVKKEVAADAAAKARIVTSQLALSSHGEKVRQDHHAHHRRMKEEEGQMQGVGGGGGGGGGESGDVEMAYVFRDATFRVPGLESPWSPDSEDKQECHVFSIFRS